MPHFLIPKPKDWRYFEWHPTHACIDLEATSEDAEHYELVINRNPKMLWCQPVFHIFPHLDQWRTKDLFQRHPDRPNLWVYKGRKDDTVVLSNAEKFNPVSMEGMIQGHEAMKGALVVGTGKFQCALIIEPKEHENAEALVEKIWPIVEQANTQAPGYAQIHKRLIMVSKPEKPFRRAGKVYFS